MGLITRSAETSKCKILHPCLPDFDLTIEVQGRFSKCYYNLLKFQEKQEREGKQPDDNKDKYAQLLADFIVDWSGVDINQQYSKEAAVQLMEDDDFYWIRNQLSLHIREDQNFFPSTSTEVEGEGKVDSGS